MSDINTRLVTFAAIFMFALNILTSDLPDQISKWIKEKMRR